VLELHRDSREPAVGIEPTTAPVAIPSLYGIPPWKRPSEGPKTRFRTPNKRENPPRNGNRTVIQPLPGQETSEDGAYTVALLGLWYCGAELLVAVLALIAIAAGQP
jgi:hypothetical protein